ncbi:TetR/AcrR family transcriptional regulator [Glutamicibacter sp.]|uniref:TetR/AcrR family transcriptional regulator n=1 Tax=Glutamicibacter sp. TaxID=1931995 RepID=UPI0028BD5C91|nr:TetR/AcrR family transcriptional regulator [Glutamicibacter sp.]
MGTAANAGLSKRMQKTRLSITRTARSLTAELGYNGFTIEQLCEKVGISRRTFFNYFPGKLDAIFGHSSDDIPEGAIDRFIAARPAGITGISPTLLADTVALVLEQLTFDEQAIVSSHGIFLVAHKEPELLQRMMQVGPKKEAEFLDLLADREGVAPDHPLLGVLLHAMRYSTMKAIDRFVANAGARSLAEEFMTSLEAAQELFSQPLLHTQP